MGDQDLSRPKYTSQSKPAVPNLAARLLPVTLVVVSLLCAWEGIKALWSINDNTLPHLSSIVSFFGSRSQGGRGPLLIYQMLVNALSTFGVAFGGFVIGGLLGFLLALIFTQSKLLERGLMPYVVGSQTVPILAIAPMIVVGLGQMGSPDWLAKAFIAAYLTFFPVTIGMLRGLRAAAPDALALMHSYAANPIQIFLKLRLPASLPYLFTALKVAATASVIGAIVAELPAGSSSGIGVVILNAAQYYNSRPEALYAAVLVAGCIGLVFYGMVVAAEWLIVRERRVEA